MYLWVYPHMQKTNNFIPPLIPVRYLNPCFEKLWACQRACLATSILNDRINMKLRWLSNHMQKTTLYFVQILQLQASFKLRWCHAPDLFVTGIVIQINLELQHCYNFFFSSFLGLSWLTTLHHFWIWYVWPHPLEVIY